MISTPQKGCDCPEPWLAVYEALKPLIVASELGSKEIK